MIVDDEPMALVAISRRLEASGASVEICGTAESGAEALKQMPLLQPDVVFLDISMPGLSGLDVARSLSHQGVTTQIVFLTAHDDYAVEAFEVAASDYLMKPVDPERLAITLARIAARMAQLERAQLGEDVRSLLRRRDQAQSTAETSEPSIALDIGGGVVNTLEKNIVRVEAAGGYACVHHNNQVSIVRAPLTYFERELSALRFMRVHRKHLVNVAEVSELLGNPDGGATAVMRNGARVLVSRRRFAALKSRLLFPRPG